MVVLNKSTINMKFLSLTVIGGPKMYMFVDKMSEGSGHYKIENYIITRSTRNIGLFAYSLQFVPCTK